MELAKNIGAHLNEMKASSWIYWQAVENELMRHNHGLIHANFEGKEEFYLTKQYYILGNYAKFIRPGMMVYDSEDSNIVIAKDEKNKKQVIVVVNDSEKAKVLKIQNVDTLHLDGCNLYRSSETESLFKIKADTSGIYEITPYSVTTLVFDDET